LEKLKKEIQLSSAAAALCYLLVQPLDLSNLYERMPNLAKDLERHFSNSPYNIIAMYKTKKLPHFKPLQKQTQTLRKTFQNPRKN
jgi:hypothetical protein